MRAGERPLVGRRRELGAIRDLLTSVEATGGGALQVAGEPGIGKSRLLRELADRARARGQLVITGRAAEYGGELPFGVFRDALDDMLAGLQPERRAELAGENGAELSVVFPAFEGLVADPPPELQQERYRAYRAVRRLLGELAGDVPVVLVLDDVQWADPGSIELLCHLTSHGVDGAVLVATGFRPAQLPAQLHGALAAAVREHEALRLDLAPLDAAAATELLGASVPVAARVRLFAQSGGNPFFLLALAEGGARVGWDGAHDGNAEPVPVTLRDALASELSSVSPRARLLLHGAAVAGDPFDAAIAARAAGIDDAGAVDALDELLAFGLISASDAAGSFAFRHPVLRATVYELARHGWRVAAHARIAALLAGRGAHASAQAPHVERSARAGDLEAVAVLVAAGDASARRAPGLAARWYAGALRLLPGAPVAERQRIELLLALATAQNGSGQLAESRATLCEVLERLPAEDPARAPAIAFCAATEHLLGRHRDANARVRAALRTLGDDVSIEAVSLKLELAAGAAFELRAEEMLARASDALEGASRLGARALAVTAAGQIALARYFLGLPAGDAMDRAAAALDELADAELATRLDIGMWVGWAEAVLERHEQAVEHCQRALDVARATGQGATLLVTMAGQAWALVRAGRLTEAERTLDAAIDIGSLAPGLFLAVAVGLRAIARTHRGDYEAAIRAAEEGVRLAREADPGLIPGMAGLYLAAPLIEAGQARRARDVVLEMSHGNHELQTSRSGHAAAFEVLARAEIALGRLDAAESWARRAEAATHGGALPAEAAIARRAAAVVALARGDAARAAQLALDGARRAAAGAPAEAGRCRIVAARALARAGDRAGAIEALETAADELDRIGAYGYRDEAEKELRRLGRRRVRRARGPHPGGARLDALTEREREIAELVRGGRSNREIAVAIFVSEKTVERHLSRIFEKLAVPGRTALALLVASDDGRAA